MARCPRLLVAVGLAALIRPAENLPATQNHGSQVSQLDGWPPMLRSDRPGSRLDAVPRTLWLDDIRVESVAGQPLPARLLPVADATGPTAWVANASPQEQLMGAFQQEGLRSPQQEQQEQQELCAQHSEVLEGVCIPTMHIRACAHRLPQQMPAEEVPAATI